MYDKEIKAAVEAVKGAGKILKKTRNKIVDSAVGKDIKLLTDKESEKLILDFLDGFGYSILSEEKGIEDKESALVWIVDPLDGTMNYSKGMEELSCISIALWNKEKPILGVINRFMADELFVGEVGKGAVLNGKPIKTSNVGELAQAILATGFPVKRSYESSSLESFVSNIQSFKKIRMLGAAAIMGAYVGCGRVDAYIEEDIMIWDIAASAAIVEAAGGCSDIEIGDDYKCYCKLFANKKLMEKYNVKSI